MSLTVPNSQILADLDEIEGSRLLADSTTRLAKLGDLKTSVASSGDPAYEEALNLAIGQVLGLAALDSIDKYIYSLLFSKLNSFLAGEGAGTLDAYATAQNLLTAWSFLIPPNVADLYWLCTSNGSRATSHLMTPGNVFARVTLLGTLTMTGAGTQTHTLTSGIPATNGAAQGYAPAIIIAGSVPLGGTAVNGTLAVPITYSGKSASGATITGHVGTLTLDSLAAGATTSAGAWAPQTTGDRVQVITGVGTPTGTATAGIVPISSALERLPS